MNQGRPFLCGLLCGVVLLSSGACTGGGQRRPAPTAAGGETPTATVQAGTPTEAPTTPGAPEGLYPPDRRTGIAAVDTLIDAVIDRDEARVERLVRYRTLPCAPEDRATRLEPVCAASQPAGTLVEVITVGQCEGGLAGVALVRRFITIALERPRRLYAVSRVTSGGPTDYIVIFAADLVDRSAPIFHVDSDGGVVRIDLACHAYEPELRGADREPILAPLAHQRLD